MIQWTVLPVPHDMSKKQGWKVERNASLKTVFVQMCLKSWEQTNCKMKVLIEWYSQGDEAMNIKKS